MLSSEIFIFLVAHYLNPKFQYNPDVVMKGEHLRAVITVFETLYPHDDCSEIGIEVCSYLNYKKILTKLN